VTVGLVASFDNIWKGIWEKAGELNSTEAYIMNDEPSI
jgi:hypothetical protein